MIENNNNNNNKWVYEIKWNGREKERKPFGERSFKGSLLSHWVL